MTQHSHGLRPGDTAGVLSINQMNYRNRFSEVTAICNYDVWNANRETTKNTRNGTGPIKPREKTTTATCDEKGGRRDWK